MKIRVSVVRFRPWPPEFSKSPSRKLGLFAFRRLSRQYLFMASLTCLRLFRLAGRLAAADVRVQWLCRDDGGGDDGGYGGNGCQDGRRRFRVEKKDASSFVCNAAVTSLAENAGFRKIKRQFIDLLLWRHAEAEDGEDDLKRRLTERGEKQARAMGAWIRAHQPKDLRIIVSPAVRTQQTAEALKLPFETISTIGPDAGVADLIATCGWPDAGGAVLVVGHQPVLGQLAALLLAGQDAEWTIKKGALWWLSNRTRGDETQTLLRAVIPAELLG